MHKKRILPIIAVASGLFAAYNSWFWISEPSFGKNSYGYFVFLSSNLRKVPTFNIIESEPLYRFIRSKDDTSAISMLSYKSKDSINTIIQSYINYFSQTGYFLVPSTLPSDSQEFVSDSDYFVVKIKKTSLSDIRSVSVSFFH